MCSDVAKGRLAVVVAALCASTALGGAAFAQVPGNLTQGIAPKTGPVVLKAADPGAASTDATQLLPALLGVKIVDKPQTVRAAGAKDAGVTVDGTDVPAAVRAVAQGYLGKPVSPKSLDAMVRDMVLAYRALGQPVVNVLVPPQDITAGVVQVLAISGRLGKVTVTGASDAAAITEGFTLRPGDRLLEGPVLDQLRWTGRRANVDVSGAYAPGAQFGTTDVEFQVTQGPQRSGFLGIDNSGSAGGVGAARLFAGLNYDGFLRPDDELSYQLTTSEKGPKGLFANVATYTLPFYQLPRTDVQFTLSYVTSETASAGTTRGKDAQLGVTFRSYLPTRGAVSSDLSYGFTYKSANSDFLFGGATASTTSTDMGLFALDWTGSYTWNAVGGDFSLGLFGAPGGLFGHDNDADYAAVRAGSVASFAYVKFGVSGRYPLAQGWTVSADLSGQLAGDRLAPSEMFYIGGLSSVRGFDDNIARGDSGYVLRLELDGPQKTFGGKGGTEQGVQFFGFVDHGAVRTNGTLGPTEVRSASLTGAGVGLRYQYGARVTFEGTLGGKVAASGVSGVDDGQVNLRLMSRF